MNDAMRQMLAKYLQEQTLKEALRGQPQGGGGAPPPGGPPGDEGLPLPQISTRDMGGKLPQVSGQFSLPAGDGEVTARGKFFKPDPQAPADWGAMLGYTKPF